MRRASLSRSRPEPDFRAIRYAGLPAKLFAGVDVPTLVIAGSRDTVAGSPIPLAGSIPGARAVVVPGRSHLSVISDAFFKGAVMGFLGDRRR